MADSLLDQAAGNPIGGLMSLLAPIVSGGAVVPARGQLLTPDQIDQSTPAWLAFAQRMAQAGGPTLGPPVTTGQALTSAMGAGYSAERQAQMLPFLVSAAQREQEAGQLELERNTKLAPFQIQQAQQDVTAKGLANQKADFDLMRERALFSVEKKQLDRVGGAGTPPTTDGAGPAGGAPTPPAGSAPGLGPRSDLGPAASATDLAALPDVQRLPDATRVPFIQAAGQIGMPLPVAAQYARMLPVEGQGLHIDPKTGAPWVSSAGAVGAAQVMPGTFRLMQAKYGFPGNLTDLMPNLLAGGHYLMDQVSDHGMHGGVIAYNAGPGGLERYLANGKLPDETADYLVKTGAPGAGEAPGWAGTLLAGRAQDGTMPGGQAPADLAQPTMRPVMVAGPGAPTEPDGPAAPTPALDLSKGQGPAEDDLVTDPLTGAKVPPDVLKAARSAIFTPGPAGSGIAVYSKVISDYVASTAAKGRVVAVPPEVLAAHGYDPRVPMTATLLPNGTMTDLKPSGGRNPLAQIETEIEMNKSYNDNPLVKNFMLSKGYLARMTGLMAQLGDRPPTALDDMALMKNYAHLNDPNAVVKVGDEQKIYESEGTQSTLKQMWQRVVGGDTLLDAQRQGLINSALAEVAGMEASAAPIMLERRRLAELAGVRPDAVAIPGHFSKEALKVLTATPEGAATPGAPTGPTGTTLTVPRPGVVVSPNPLPSGRDLAPPGAAPAAPAAPAGPNTGPPATVDRFTEGQWKGFTSMGLANIAEDMVKNPGHYSVRDRQRLLDAAQAAKPK